MASGLGPVQHRDTPRIQPEGRARAVEIAHRANDLLAEEVAKRPDRFQGLAALPMQDPDAAARELARCVRDLGFRGALVNGSSQVDDPADATYYDLPQYRPFWTEVERLGVPFYLHPRNPLPERPSAFIAVIRPRRAKGHGGGGVECPTRRYGARANAGQRREAARASNVQVGRTPGPTHPRGPAPPAAPVTRGLRRRSVRRRPAMARPRSILARKRRAILRGSSRRPSPAVIRVGRRAALVRGP